MAYDVHAMLEAVAATVAATWTDVLPPGGGIWDINQIERISFDEVSGEGFPFAVFHFEPTGAGNFGLANADLFANLHLYYVNREDLTAEPVWDKIEAVKSAILADSYTGMTVLDVIGQDIGPTNPILNFFFMRSVPYTAGSVSFLLDYGEEALP